MAKSTSTTRFIIANTDERWFDHLRALEAREVNFWVPSGAPVAVAKGTPWFYKRNGVPEIVGVGFFAAYTVMPLLMAWKNWGEANGRATLGELVRAIASRRREGATPISEIGCAALVDPVYFKRPVPYQRLYGPRVAGDTRDADDARLWNALTEAMNLTLADYGVSPIVLPGGWGTPTLVHIRLGQSSFRAAVLSAYERRCAVTGERTIPALEAAHIRRFADVERHEVRNGLLMRSDIHALFDAGLVTVDTSLHFRVSSQIRERYANGRDYYALEGREIRSPLSAHERPLSEYLDYHSSEVFQP